MADCAVHQISACPDGNIADRFVEGRLIGRSEYGHPALFQRFIGANGFVGGHRYGTGAPGLGEPLLEGRRYEYTREVYRNLGESKLGDNGVEVLQVGGLATIELGGRSYSVRDIKFEVTNEDGYRYIERALLMVEPELTLGLISTEFAADGTVEETGSRLPEQVSLPSDPDFLGFDPAPSCLPST